MKKVFKCIRAILIAVINICLLCPAGHVLDWFTYLFKKTQIKYNDKMHDQHLL